MTLLSESMKTGEICKVEKASRKAMCSVLSIVPMSVESHSAETNRALKKASSLNPSEGNQSTSR
jgi:hypothetical protein